MQPNPRLKNVYDFLRTQNVKNFPKSYGEFESKMGSDQSLSGNVYNYLKSHNVKNLPDTYEVFYESVGLKKKEPAGQSSTSTLQTGGESTLPDQGNTVALSPEQQEAFRNLPPVATGDPDFEKQRFESDQTRAKDARVRDIALGIERPNPESNILTTTGKSIWNVLRYQLPSGIVAGVAALNQNLPKGSGAEVTYGSGFVKEEDRKKANVEALKWADKQQKQGAEFTKDLVSSLDKVEDPLDFINWVGYATGQAAGQIPVAIGTFGVSSIGQEVGSIYLEGVKKIAEEKGLVNPVTGEPLIEAVINQELDDPAAAIAWGTAAGALDYVGAKGVMSFGKSQFKKALRDRVLVAKAAGTEGGTEYTQTFMEQIGSNRVAGNDLSKAWDNALRTGGTERLEALAQGAVGGGGAVAITSAIPNKKGKNVQATEQGQKVEENAPVEDTRAQDAPVEKESDSKITPEEDIPSESSPEQAEIVEESQDNVIKDEDAEITEPINAESAENVGEEVDDMSSKPLMSAYNNRIEGLDKEVKHTDVSNLSIGDFVNIPKSKDTSGFTGFVKSIGRKNIVVESPYGGWGGQDYISIQEIKTSKDNVSEFLKPQEFSQFANQETSQPSDTQTGEAVTQEQQTPSSDAQETIQTETKDDTLPQSEEVEFDWLGTTKKGKIISEEDGKYKIKGTDGTIFRVKKSDVKNGSVPDQTQQQPNKPKTKKRVITQAKQEKPSDSGVSKEVGEKQSVESLSQDLDTIVGKQKEATKKDPKIIAANLNPLLIAKAAWTGLNKAQNLTFGKFAKKTEDWVSKKVKKGVSSKNYALRNASNSLQSLLGGLAYEHGDLKNKLNYMGNKNYAHLKAKMLAEDMYKIIDSDPASLSRLQAVLDPETSVGTEQEGLSYDDLNDTEKSLHDIIRKTNDFVHDWHFKEGLIDKETYNKNKGSYIARLYEDFELIDPEVEAAFKSSRADFNMFKQRKDFEDVHAKIMRDPVYATAKRVSQMLQNQAIFDYAKAISNSDTKVSDEEFPGSTLLPAGSRSYFVTENGKKVKKTDKINYYGDLSGKYVPSHIAQDFKGFSFANKAMQYLYEGARKYDKWAFRQFLKRSKTVYNPLVRTGNILSNFSFSFAAGIDPFTFFLNRFEAKKQIKAKSENYQDLVKAGLIGTDAFTSDITPLKVKDNPKSIIGKAGNVINKAGNWAAETYGKADDVAKLSAYISFLQDGYSKQDAIEQVYEGFQNYATVGKAFDFGSKLPVVGNPFIKFKADLMRIIKNSVTRRPLTTMAYLGGIVGLQSLFSDWSDEDDEIKKIRERRNFIPKIKTPFGDIPLVFQTPFGEINVARYMSPYYIYDKGDNGDIVNDITEWLPIQFERTRDSAFPIKPEMSDVFLGTYAQILFDTDFRGMSILDPDATPFTGGIATTEEKIANALNYIARSQIPMFRSSQDMISAYNGEADYYGRERDMTQALLNNIIKIQEFGEEQARETLTKEIKYKMGKFESLSRDVSQLKSASKKKISKILSSETMPQETKSRLIQEEAEALNKRILVKLQEQAEITKELNEPAKLLKSLD